MDLLRVVKLTSGYGESPILNQVSCEVADKSLVAIVGSNGAGKTTLLNTISGILRPYSGKIYFKGKEINGLPPHEVARLGISHVPEGRKIFPNLSVLENLKVVAYLARENMKNGTLKKVFEMFPILEERKSQPAKTLSGGEAQMLAIARGLMRGPSLLMLDEPSLGLAPKVVAGVYDSIKAIKENGVSILLVEQNIRYALEVADKAYVLENGKIAMQGKGRELLKNKNIRKHYLSLK
ncbi:MAG: ABC transporter ATP-binding protein [Candidatus Hadarchaeum sp.]|uniref:ABC transporter ATP-binding protein n=1 Tax=Candidatus Hadarchaeum sp. TaxID=2883567 RepID=UPI00317D3140